MDATVPEDDISAERDTIFECLAAIQQHVNVPFILVGGAGGIMAGSQRTTSDIDLLLPTSVGLTQLQEQILGIKGFSAPGGKLAYTSARHMTIDFLTSVPGEKTYEELQHHVFLQDNTNLLNFDVALAIKLHCYGLRQDDANGMKKQASDLRDVGWLSAAMAARGETISAGVIDHFKIGHYRMLIVRFGCRDLRLPDVIPSLVAVGASNLVCPWDEDTDEQKEYFSYFAPEGTCPLTCELLEDEEEGEEEK
ncbi:hypothetical protein SCUCBS95973_006461 [Sporothrix curviconia]|uniref:Uncharacterized protein n=1 Tax=Sporothrix curviconia TaxID=1260050 RepID=A0ABP0C7S0_9PEZI